MPKRLPGDMTQDEQIARIIRVNHAGEYGAKRIYEGQLRVLKDHACAPTIQHMKEQEQEHLDYFENAVVERGVRPTLLQPFWHVAGYALGAGTALMGEKAAMACTIAVEEVIEEHYQEQLDALDDDEDDLKKSIARFQAEEIEHRDIGIEHKGLEAPAYQILSGAIKTASKAAIWLAKRV